MFTKLKGVTFEGRQKNILELQPEQKLKLKKSPNVFHSNAILVTTLDDKELGYISRTLADKIYNELKDNYYCKVVNITGKDIKGVNVYIKINFQ